MNSIMIFGYAFKEWQKYYFAYLKDTPIHFVKENYEFWLEVFGLLLCAIHGAFLIVIELHDKTEYETALELYESWPINVTLLMSMIIGIHWV